MANRKVLGLALFIAFCGLASYMFYQGQARFLVARLQSDSNQESWLLFQDYVKRNNKAYNGQEEFLQRYDIFHQNYLFIQNENQKGYSYKLALNQFADLTAQEFKELYLNLIPRNHDIRMKSDDQMDNLPDSIDWFEKGAVNPVRDQGRCGSCWAFSTIAGIESAYYLKNGKLVDFSEQQLVDCSRKYGNKGCAGGLLEESYEYFMDFQFEKESDYPYEANDNSCWYQEKLGQGYLSNYVNVKKNELALKASVSQRPTPILVDASTWQFYKEGILSNCNINLDHAVIAVGYGTDNGQMFWKIKNSWGTGWGEQGFIRILRTESETSQGQCGVAVDPVYPVL